MNVLQGLNAFASGRLDVELDEATRLAYRDAFAARQPSGAHFLCCLLLLLTPLVVLLLLPLLRLLLDLLLLSLLDVILMLMMLILS